MQWQDEEQQELMTAAIEVVPVLAAQLPVDEFGAMFHLKHAVALLKLCQPSQPDDIRATAIGAPAV